VVYNMYLCVWCQRLELQVLELQTALGHKDKQLMEVQHRCMYVPTISLRKHRLASCSAARRGGI
jgi:hypothetical protein